MTRPANTRPRAGFTLVELLVVLVILAVLIALLVPAVMGAVRKARSASVQAEINNMAQALAGFKSKYGDYPPSKLMLNETGYLDTTSSSSGAIAQRSLIAFRKFWPRVAMSSTNSVSAPLPSGTALTGWYDFNGNGTLDHKVNQAATGYILQGHECLVFFLGGIPSAYNDTSTGTIQLSASGFGTSPTNPFSNNLNNGNSMYSTNRQSPLFEFAVNRLQQTGTYQMMGYLDSLSSSTATPPQNYYVYFSTNLGAGYDPNDVNFTEADSNNTSPVGLAFFQAAPAYVSAAPNPYTTTPTVGTTVTFQNPQTYQIISAGQDGQYGLGGYYNASGTGGAVLPAVTPATLTNSTDGAYVTRRPEADNLTNFKNGSLD